MAVGQSAKNWAVKSFGVGEELAMNLMGWRGDALVAVAQMDLLWGDPSNHSERIERVAVTANTLRRGFGCDSFTLLGEGWISDNPDKTKGRDLVKAFADNDDGVNECLSILHVEETEDVRVCAIPFRVKLGREVEYGPMMHSESSSMVRQTGYLDVLLGALSLPLEDLLDDYRDPESLYVSLAMELADYPGFFLQYDFD